MQRVLHVLRAPVGGLFRHVRDLVAAQQALGLAVGVVCDSNAADALTRERLAALEPHLSLGLHLIPMRRAVGLGDAAACRSVVDVAARCGAEILHGHGAKGGAYARLAALALRRKGRDVACFYTPHGGTLNYAPDSLAGRVFQVMERRLEKLTTGIIFESAWSARMFRRHVTVPTCAVRVIPNGLLPSDFEPIATAHDAVDVLFVGELRDLKGIDVLLEAIAAVRLRHDVRAMIVGDGPDRAMMMELAEALGLAGHVTFPGAMPARKAFARGRMIVVPSRKESFPYIVLEAAAAGMPLIATSVGGIPEIVEGTDTGLVPIDHVGELAAAIRFAVEQPAVAKSRAERLRARVHGRFTADLMARDVVRFYTDCSHRLAA